MTLTLLTDKSPQHYLFDREKGCTDLLYVAEELGRLTYSECSACAVLLEIWEGAGELWRQISTWFMLEVSTCSS